MPEKKKPDQTWPRRVHHFARLVALSQDRLLRCAVDGEGINTVETFTALGACQSCGGNVRYAFWPECCDPLGNAARCLGCGERVELVKPTNPDFPAWRRHG